MRKSLLRLLTAALALPAAAAAPATATAGETAAIREVEITVKGGFRPDRVELKAGERVRLKFVRHEDDTCTREVVFPGLAVRAELPPHRAVLVDLPALAAGEHPFRCGMGMIHGMIVAR